MLAHILTFSHHRFQKPDRPFARFKAIEVLPHEGENPLELATVLLFETVRSVLGRPVEDLAGRAG